MVDPAREDSFESFFRSYYGSVVRALVIVAGSESEAEDLAQEAFARALERWDRVRSMASPIGYVYRIAFNLNRNRLRHVARGLRRRSEPAPEPDPASEAETRSERSGGSSPLCRRASGRRSSWWSGSAWTRPRPDEC